MTDDGLAAMAASLSELRTLELEGCAGVGDAGRAAVAEHCPGLRCFEVDDGGTRARPGPMREFVCGAAFTHLAAAHGGTLVELDLTGDPGCERLTDAGVEAVAQLFTGLDTLMPVSYTHLTLPTKA